MKKKIITREESIKIADELRKQGKKIVTINGSFDILHAGHVKMLQEAKQQGDVLFLGLNSDKSVRAWKKHIGYKDWKKRPLVPQQYRAEMLAALECVDYVTFFDEPDCLKFVESVKPDVHVNGAEYGENCVEASTVKKYGGRIHLVKRIGDFSTTKMIERIKKAY